MNTDFSLLINKDIDELYNEALEFRRVDDCSNYHMCMVMAANNGHKLAIKELFNDYQNTLYHSKQDYSFTKEFYEQTKEYSYSANYLGFIYQSVEPEPKKNKDKILELYNVAILLDNPVAIGNLGILYYKGELVDKDSELAKELLKTSLEKGFGHSGIVLGNILYDNKEYDQALLNYQQGFENGNSDTLNYIGRVFMKKDFDKKNYDTAFYYFEMSHNGGNINGTINLANCYYDGNGVKQDYNKARELAEEVYKKDNNNVGAIEYLGIMYMKGHGVSQDMKRAKEFFELGLPKDCVISMLSLATILRSSWSNGGTTDNGRAMKLYELAIEKATITWMKYDAYYELAQMYGAGEGVPVNNDKMVE